MSNSSIFFFMCSVALPDAVLALLFWGTENGDFIWVFLVASHVGIVYNDIISI